MAQLRLAAFVALVAAVFGLNLEAQVGKRQNMLDVNTASEKELLAVPHLNATLVKTILDRRLFSSMTEFNAVLPKTLTAHQRAELFGRLFLAINLNTASRDEILTIPGVGERMLHEFLEYRPYKTLAQFRKEIGKYVSQKEVARMERYVTLN